MLIKKQFKDCDDWYEELMCCSIPSSAEIIEAFEKLFDMKAWFVIVRNEPLILFCGIVQIGEEGYGFAQSVSCFY